MSEEQWYLKYLDERFANLTTLMNARFETVEDKLTSIENHVIQTNGRVTDLECESEKRQEVVDDYKAFKGRMVWIKKNWWLSLLLLMLLIVIVHFIYDAGKFGQLLGLLI